jgi:hypothetical protein
VVSEIIVAEKTKKMEKTGSKTAGDRLISLLLALKAEDAGGAEIGRRQRGHLILTKEIEELLLFIKCFRISNIRVLNNLHSTRSKLALSSLIVILVK